MDSNAEKIIFGLVGEVCKEVGWKEIKVGILGDFSSNEPSSLHMFKIRMPFKEVSSSLKL